jgi:LPXTG-motif cell wall-anchored protein
MKTRTSVAAAAFLLGLGISAPIASAYPLQHNSDETTTTSTSAPTTTTITDPGDDPGDELGEETTQASGSLPVTGGDVVGIALIGAGAVAAGTLLVRRTRKA